MRSITLLAGWFFFFLPLLFWLGLLELQTEHVGQEGGLTSVQVVHVHCVGVVVVVVVSPSLDK